MLYDRFHLNHPEIPFIIEFTPFFAILIAVVFFKMNSAPILTPIPTPTTAVNDAVAGNAATKKPTVAVTAATFPTSNNAPPTLLAVISGLSIRLFLLVSHSC